jgi:pimeloyl-ACP methyl ester carboxylesterase
MITESFVDNNQVRIHYIQSTPDGTSGMTPLVVIPGMGQAAEDFAGPMAGNLGRPSVYVSIRGRGRSDVPASGYSYREQLSDVEAVVDHLGLDFFFLMGHSVGVAFALGLAGSRPERIRGLILSDYLPHYPPLPEEWVADVLKNPEIGMPEHAVRALAAESERVVLMEELPKITAPVLVTRAGIAEESLLPEELLRLYTENLPDCRVETLEGMGHEPLDPDPGKFLGLIRKFMQEIG